MSAGNSIINLGDLSRPVTVFIEKISDAFGGIFKPFQIRRMAKAEADAQLIKAQANIEVTELQHRALVRFISEESKKQENIEKILSKAILLLRDDSKPQDIEDDWITLKSCAFPTVLKPQVEQIQPKSGRLKSVIFFSGPLYSNSLAIPNLKC